MNPKFLFLIFYFLFFISLNGGAFFEDLEIGAKATSLGGAFTARTDDISTVFYNPAGLIEVEGVEILTSYGTMYRSLSNNHVRKRLLAFSIPVSKISKKQKRSGNMAAAFYRYSLNSLYSEDNFKFAYSFPVRKNLYGGIGFSFYKINHGKTISEEINTILDNNYSNSFVGADLGLIYTGKNINIGLAVMNIKPSAIALKYQTAIRRKLNAGVSIKKKMFNLSLDTVLESNKFKFKTGIETSIFKEVVALRAGLNFSLSKTRNSSAGLGYKGSWYEIDYSFNYPSSGISDVYGAHQLNLIFRLGKEEIPDFSDEEKMELPKNIEEAKEYVTKAKKDFASGLYSKALKEILNASYILNDDREVIELIRKGRIVTDITDNIKGKDKKSIILRKAINAYILRKGRTSINYIRYASQLWPEDVIVAEIFDIVGKEFRKISNKEKWFPEINFIYQKLQQVLHSIYNGRYINAIIVCRDVLELEPDNIVALQRMGSAYWTMGYTEKANEIWKQALSIEPDNEEIKNILKLGGEAEKIIVGKEPVKRKPAEEKLFIKKEPEIEEKSDEEGISEYKKIYDAIIKDLESFGRKKK